MTDDRMSQADLDIDYLYAKAKNARIAVEDLDEDRFLELMAHHGSRAKAFEVWAKLKGR